MNTSKRVRRCCKWPQEHSFQADDEWLNIFYFFDVRRKIKLKVKIPNKYKIVEYFIMSHVNLKGAVLIC